MKLLLQTYTFKDIRLTPKGKIIIHEYPIKGRGDDWYAMSVSDLHDIGVRPGDTVCDKHTIQAILSKVKREHIYRFHLENLEEWVEDVRGEDDVSCRNYRGDVVAPPGYVFAQVTYIQHALYHGTHTSCEKMHIYTRENSEKS